MLLTRQGLVPPDTITWRNQATGRVRLCVFETITCAVVPEYSSIHAHANCRTNECQTHTSYVTCWEHRQILEKIIVLAEKCLSPCAHSLWTPTCSDKTTKLEIKSKGEGTGIYTDSLTPILPNKT